MTIIKETKIDHTYHYANGGLDNDGGSLQLVDTAGSDQFIVVDKCTVSITKGAFGSDGVVQIKDTVGTIIREVNADEMKDVDLGEFKVGPGVGLQAIIANAGEQQAKASVTMKSHITYR